MGDHFPILGRGKNSVPLAFVEQCREWARINHSQSLERLAERGGLSWAELYMCLIKERWAGRTISEDKANAAIGKIFSTWLQEDRENLTPERIEIVKQWYADA